jgi:hypothetical protein
MATQKPKSVEQATDDFKTEVSNFDWALLTKNRANALDSIDNLMCRLMNLSELIKTDTDYDGTTQA